MAKCVMLKSGGISDVTVGGASVVVDGVASIGYAGTSKPGVIKFTGARRGHSLFQGQNIIHDTPSAVSIENRTAIENSFMAVTLQSLDNATKAAMTDGKGAAWTDAERLAALARMGCTVGDDGTVSFTAQET